MQNLSRKIRKSIIKLLWVAVVFVFMYWLTHLVQDNGVVRNLVLNLGYPGVLLVSLVSGFNLLIPIPAPFFIPVFVEAGLSIWVIIFFIIIGTSIADSISYVIGVVGREFAKSLKRRELFRWLDTLRNKYYWGPIVVLFFFAALVPLPNEIILMPLGFMGYKIRHVLISYVAGNIIFTTLSAFSIVNIFNII